MKNRCYFIILMLLLCSVVYAIDPDSTTTTTDIDYQSSPYDPPAKFDDEDIKEDPNSIDGDFSDKFVQIMRAKGYRTVDKIHRLYWLVKAHLFRTEPYYFENIKTSNIYLHPNGRMKLANITSEIDNNSFQFLNPLAHSTIPETYSTVDSDGDGLSDFVEKKFNFLTDKADSDDDGLTDFEEFMTYGTNPLSESSGASINGSPATDQEYINFLTSLYNEHISTKSEIIQGINVSTIPNFEHFHFQDSDGDAISDYIETKLGLDINNPDSDEDGTTDGLEIGMIGTSPTNPDTDNDGLKDGQDPVPLVNEKEMFHSTLGFQDTFMTIIADENESFVYIVSDTISIQTNDKISIFIGKDKNKYEFNTSGNHSMINITKTSKGYSFAIRETTLKTERNEEIQTSNMTIVNVSIEYDVECLALSPISRYTWKGNSANDPYSIYINNQPFIFYIRKAQEQDFDIDTNTCNQCGLIDLVKKNMSFRGIFEYEKKMETFDSFSDCIQSKADNKFNLIYDPYLINFKGSLSSKGESILHSSFFRMITNTSTYFDLLSAPIVKHTTDTFVTNIENATMTATRNELIIKHQEGGILRIVGENTPEHDAVIKMMRDFR